MSEEKQYVIAVTHGAEGNVPSDWLRQMTQITGVSLLGGSANRVQSLTMPMLPKWFALFEKNYEIEKTAHSNRWPSWITHLDATGWLFLLELRRWRWCHLARMQSNFSRKATCLSSERGDFQCKISFPKAWSHVWDLVRASLGHALPALARPLR
jgi:hypothetical protein